MVSKKKLINLFFITGISFCLCSPGLISMAQEHKEEVCMKVNFYTVDIKTQNKGESLGFAEFKEGKLINNVTDPELEKLLKYDFTTTGGKTEEITLPSGRKVLRGGIVVYESGTPEHLRAIAEKAKDFGYIGEIVDK